ncbi:hypothetical protein QTP88_025026 [Uroleucon formosanum]
MIHLTHIYNAILRTEYVPKQWKQAQVIMLLKPRKPPEQVTSYRPISLLPSLSKLFEKLLLKRLKPIIEVKQLIPEHQFGFRSKHSTIEQVHRVTNIINKALEEKKYCCGVFLDIAQAFDKVWHKGLLIKLREQLPHTWCALIKSYLSELNNYSMTAMFADDTAILATDEDQQTATDQLQRTLNNVSNWTKRWKIEFLKMFDNAVTLTQLPKSTRNSSNLKISYKILFFEIIDNILMQITTRFQNSNKLIFLQLADVTKFKYYCNKFPDDAFKNLGLTYSNIFHDLKKLKAELEVLYSDTNYQNLNHIYDLVKIFELEGLKTVLPEAYNLFSLILTLPSTSVSVERSFSCLKRIKTYLQDKKRAGGAAREREKNKKLLLKSSKNCKKLNLFFNSAYYEKQNSENPVKTEELSSEVLCLTSESPPVVFNKFIKPSSTVLSHFFKYHPCQPKDPSLPFNPNKIFLRENGTNRVWPTFDESSKQLFCSVCLAFASESNSFTKGLIGKRGLNYRGKRNEAAYSLNDHNLDHGNFLEIMILLSKYDPIICEHFNTIINKSEKKQKQNKRGRGSFLTFLSKNTVQVVINEIASNIKRTIATEVQNASFFSVLIDTTQDVSVMDQCSIVIRYIFHGTINEKLIAVKCVHNSSGKGMAELLKEELISVGLDLTKCIGNSTDGASNM